MEESSANAVPVFPERMLQASAVSAERVIVPISVPTGAVSDTEKDCEPVIARVRSLTVTDIVKSVVAESAESVALTCTTYTLFESASAGDS